jgi:hypothetical protein
MYTNYLEENYALMFNFLTLLRKVILKTKSFYSKFLNDLEDSFSLILYG